MSPPRRSLLALLAIGPVALALPVLVRAAGQPEITKAQPELAKEKLVIVTHDGQRHEFSVELAAGETEQITGLMFRTSVPADGGMLFDWGRPRQSQMWMRNTKVPLDMVFIDETGVIRRIAEDTVPESLAIIDGGPDVRATLELAGGTTARLNIRVGDKVEARQFAKGG